MFILLLAISILLLVVGIVMIFFPQAAGWLNNSGNIVILTEKKVFEHRWWSGVISLGFGIFFIYKANGYTQIHTQVLVTPFYLIGILLTLFGVLFFISGNFFEKINSLTSKKMVDDKLLMRYPRVTGAFFAISGFLVYLTAKYFA